MEGSRTPPRSAGGAADGGEQMTPEQVRKMAENRLRAKARLQERERQERERAARAASTFAPSNALNPNAKRPLQVAPADSTSPTAPNTRSYPSRPVTNSTVAASNALQNAIASGSGGKASVNSNPNSNVHFKRDDPNIPLKNMIGTYVEYDLATLKNSRGGFLMENEEDDPKKLRERQLMEENRKKRELNMKKRGLIHEPGVSSNPAENPKCAHCGSSTLDPLIQAVFGVLVCVPCKNERPDSYSLLTKTECKEDYLLTERTLLASSALIQSARRLTEGHTAAELKDEELLPHLLKPNPHRPTYSNMMLFLRMQVEAFAFSDKKWGSPEALDAEFERRELEKKDKKSKKFEKRLKELRKKTKTNVWHKRVEGEHKHTFGETENGDDGAVQRCTECGFEVEVEVF